MQLPLTLMLVGFPVVLASVPIFMCSWKISDGSPELVGFEWWCNAEKKITSNATADYACHYVDRVADFGAQGFEKQLRFRAACPHERNDGWGYTSWHSCGNPWAVCVGANGPNDKPIQCFYSTDAHALFLHSNSKWVDKNDDCLWPTTFDSAEAAPSMVQIWNKK
ncbi:hypothetical protein BDZ90DRAFT_227726 [Jaminaea rosea]|uniref:Cyanovirin-N domain-containing protein n=1 Tax=Jaminaea rosea TaxID=1569628 RepID=A0A316UMM7_9BASI|nr:hypothetical protein BDZ90DRAFT_227726 [Jaminaea rosea]PWN26527.1 hypothetical protein BDZ90DRAFT_227726 [Jaminaea rosea]